MKHIAIAFAAAIVLAGCAASGSVSGSAADLADTPAAMTCRAEPAQYHIGQAATQATGTAILKDTHARALRWGPPNSAWTMDFRQDRVNVRYDAAMTITEITCG